MNLLEHALKEHEEKLKRQLFCRWTLGFKDRGMGHGDWAVVTTGEVGKLEVIVECPNKEIAEHIIELHNARLPSAAEAVKEYLKDIPGFYVMGVKSPLEDLVAYVNTKKAKKAAEQRLAKWDFGVKVEVKVMGKLAPLGGIH